MKGATHSSGRSGERGATVELRPPPGDSAPPAFDRGWHVAGMVEPYLSYVQDEGSANWSGELEAMHEESSRSHFIDVWTRRAMLARIGPLAQRAVVVDLGCSSGYLLEELEAAHPDALLVGIDIVAAGLRRAHSGVPGARLLQADACAIPLADGSVDAVLSANLLEHVPDDERALAELRRVLRPGALAVVVVPAGPRLYDYYDRFLGHERRYERRELAARARLAGLEVIDDIYLGSVLYPAFWLVKQRNRRRRGQLRGAELEARVKQDIERTRNSRIGELACHLEEALLDRRVRLPAGIRELAVFRRPASSS